MIFIHASIPPYKWEKMNILGFLKLKDKKESLGILFIILYLLQLRRLCR